MSAEKYETHYAKGLDEPTRAKFFGMIANIDDNVGRLMAKLKEWGLERDTLVIFMNDNGGTGGVQGLQRRHARRRRTRPGWAARASAVLALAGHAEARRRGPLAGAIDFFPTLRRDRRAPSCPTRSSWTAAAWCRCCATPRPRGPTASCSRTSAAGNAGKAAESKYAEVQGAQQPLSPWCSTGPEKNWELYDLQADPGEQEDVAAKHPEVVRAMDAAYDKWWAEILPCLENEDAVPPEVTPYKELY